ncbi:hypothetical protein ABPG77_010357 [Micractinium sp. CCAP 211/92]
MISKIRWQRIQTLLFKRAFSARSIEEHRARSGTDELPKVLGPLDLTFLGLGSIIGAGVFVLSGVAARELAGPAVITSYLVSATAALLSALCYTEMAVSLPITGGAFNYISISFGELAAWLVAWNMCLETTLSSAAVARGFASYLATLLGLQPSSLRISAGPLELDPAAAALILLLTAILAKGTRESSIFNMVVTALNIASILFILCAGFPKAHAANLSPFAPFGARGVFSAAAVLFFSFVGFDYVANAAEEAKDPAKHLPLGIVGSLGIATALYLLMALCIVLMVPYQQIDINAPFSAAFLQAGMAWAAKVVSLGAVLGIVTSTMTGLLGQSRLLVVLGRERLLPLALAEVSERFGTPVRATVVTGAAAATLAFVLDIGILAELVSIGTLYVFLMVCSGVLYMRYHQPGSGSSALPILAALGGLVLTAIGFSVAFTFSARWGIVLLCLLLFAAITASLLALPIKHTPERFQVPFFPLTPACGIGFPILLTASLGWPAYVRFGAWMLAGLAVYALYGVHGAEQRELEHLRERELAARQMTQASSSSRRLTSLDREGYAGPMGALELGQVGSGGGMSRGYLAQQQRDFMRATDRARLMAGMRNSSAYDAEED